MTCFQCSDDFFEISGAKSIVSRFSSTPFDICTRTLAQEPSNMKFTVIMTALVLISSSALGMPTEQNEVARRSLKDAACRISCSIFPKPDCYNKCIGCKYPLTKSQDVVTHPLIFRGLRKNSPLKLVSSWG
jgi:hypothetical protein